MVDRTRQRTLTVPLAAPYSVEYRAFGADAATLQLIAETTGGRVLDGAADLPAVSSGTSTEYSPLHGPLLLAALGVFLLDLVARKWPSGTPRER